MHIWGMFSQNLHSVHMHPLEQFITNLFQKCDDHKDTTLCMVPSILHNCTQLKLISFP